MLGINGNLELSKDRDLLRRCAGQGGGGKRCHAAMVVVVVGRTVGDPALVLYTLIN